METSEGRHVGVNSFGGDTTAGLGGAGGSKRGSGNPGSVSETRPGAGGGTADDISISDEERYCSGRKL